MAYYPIFLELDRRPCLVIGGGAVAARKAKQLAACGARVRVVSPECGAGLKQLAARRKVSWTPRLFKPSDLKGAELVIAATDCRPVNEQASRLARRKRIWINVVDQPRLCSFNVPSVVRRGKLEMAISTGGASPALSRWIRKDLEKRYGSELGRLLEQSAKMRSDVRKKMPSAAQRRRLYGEAIEAYFKVMRRVLG